jgi:Ca-activated chloride channel family protein
MNKRWLRILIVLVLVAGTLNAATLSRSERKERIRHLGDKYRQFLIDVEPIIAPEEQDTFLQLESDPQRDLYIEDFWKRRDTAAGVSNFAYRDGYYARIETAKERFGSASSDRGRIFLIHGEPQDLIKSDTCRLLQPMELWTYEYIPAIGHKVHLIFYEPRPMGNYQLWHPSFATGQGEAYFELISEEVIATTGSTTSNESAAIREVFGPCDGIHPETGTKLECTCPHALDILKAMTYGVSTKEALVKSFEPPAVNKEDVKRILHSVVIATKGATKLDAAFSVQYPPTEGHRTDAQMVVLVPKSQLQLKENAGTKMYNLDVNGEVLKDDELYETYRYHFDYPADASDKLPVVIDRLLPAGEYKSRIRIGDINSNAEAIVEETITVPAPHGAAAVSAGTKEQTPPLRLVPLPDELLAGPQTVSTITTPDVFAVEFSLDGKKMMTKRNAPFTLQVDLGNVPRLHRIGASALNAKGEQIAADELIVNNGNDPFRVRINSPRVASKIHGKTRVEMSVGLPELKKLQKLELFVNETPAATLYAEPYVASVDVPDSVGYLRAVATLDDPNEAPVEDVVIFNAPGQMEEVNVHLVEMPTTVLRDNHPVTDLDESAFRVIDDGKLAKIAKFEHVKDLPLSIGLAVDTSSSMKPRIAEAQKDAAQFLSSVMKPGDKAFLMSFDVRPQMVQRWTTDFASIGAGLAKLRTDESTALYDAIVYSLYNFLNVKAPKALIVMTDGDDTASKFTFDQALEYARRSGVPVYTIGIGISQAAVDVRYHLGKLCAETGGTAYFVDQPSELPRIYASIQDELRSQYIIGIYPPPDVKAGSKWRPVSVEVTQGKAKTIRGYYP